MTNEPIPPNSAPLCHLCWRYVIDLTLHGCMGTARPSRHAFQQTVEDPS
jgi:hypothetical protein